MLPQNSANLQSQLSKIRREAEERDALARAKARKAAYIDLSATPISIEAVALIPENEARSAKVAAIQLKEHEVALAGYDPNLPETQTIIQGLESRKFKVKLFVVSISGLEQAWKFYEFVPVPAEKITGNVAIEKNELDRLVERFKKIANIQADLAGMDYEHESTTQFFQIILAGSIATKSSDIHLEAGEKQCRIRFRIDGILHTMGEIPPRNFNNLINRIKLLSELKINVREEAQDGRFTIKLSDKEIEVRVSIIPSEFGETVVMRILDPAAISVELPQLGLREDDLALIEKELSRPNGLVLNTGPTGSGKTTTLYAFLRHVASSENKVITVEDPIEYRLSGIEQTQVDPDAGYTFASGLRSILRQDPDVILVGEIRDAETADIALQAALTGHLVFSTLHTNNAVGAVPRLVDLGVKPSSIGPAVSLIIAQRLVRRLCEKCKKPAKLPEDKASKIKSFLEKLPKRVSREPFFSFMNGGGQVFESAGCEACNNFGYKGRIGIFEFLRSGGSFEEAVLSSASESSLRKIASTQEMVTMQQDGILKVLKGETTFDEVESATGPMEWGVIES